MSFTKHIFLDNNSTTLPPRRVLDEALKWATAYNPSNTLVPAGQRAHDVIEKTAAFLADFIKCPADCIAFTSGSSESNSSAVITTITHSPIDRRHIVSSVDEHSSTIHSIEEVVKHHGATVTWIQPNSEDLLDPDVIAAAITSNTSLVSIIHAQNETGALNDVRQIAAKVREKNPETFIHFDCTQSFGKMRYTLEEIGNPDFVSISAHKFYGLKGSGIMYISPRARAEPLSFSSVVKGPQQRALRGGTENVMAIASIIPALEYNFEEGVQNRISLVTDYLTSRLRRFNKDWVHIHGPENPAQRVNNTVFVTFPKAAKCSFGLVQALAEQGIDVGAGSACKVNEFAKSKKEMPDHSIRISVGRSTSGLDCDKLIEALDRLIH